jgi:hypothetical protein
MPSAKSWARRNAKHPAKKSGRIFQVGLFALFALFGLIGGTIFTCCHRCVFSPKGLSKGTQTFQKPRIFPK